MSLSTPEKIREFSASSISKRSRSQASAAIRSTTRSGAKTFSPLPQSARVLRLIGLKLNPSKTRLAQARSESFDFLGYTFGPHRLRKDGHWYLGASPSKRSVGRLEQKLRELLRPSNVGTREQVRDRLNRSLRGWSSYFSYGTRLPA